MSTTLTVHVNGLVIHKVRERFPNIDPKITPEQFLKQFKLGSNRVRSETCLDKCDNSAPTCIRAVQVHCSRPMASPEFAKHVIETPQRWTNVTYHSNSQQYFDKFC